MSKLKKQPEKIDRVLKPGKQGGGPIKMTRRLTPKQRIAMKALLEGKSYREASSLAGYARPHHVKEVLRPNNPDGKSFRAEWARVMDRAGLSDGKLLRPINDALFAKNPRWNNKTQRWDQFADHPVRLKAAEMGLNLKGRFPKGDTAGPMVAVAIYTNLEDEAEHVLGADEFVIEAEGKVNGSNP